MVKMIASVVREFPTFVFYGRDCMNSFEHEGDMPQENTDDNRQEETLSTALFPGDSGTLPFETRRTLVQLLAGPSLDGRRHARLWPVLIRDESVVRSRLSELFLDLVIDRDQQVAFTRQADVGELDAPVLLRRSPLTFVDSVLLLFLRQRLTQADARGERAVTDAAEIAESLILYERAANTDHAGFNKKVQASIEKMKKNSILQKIRGSEDRFEISPTLKLLFSPEEILALTRRYQEMVSEAVGSIAADPELEDESE
jgi:hypothetical protein